MSDHYYTVQPQSEHKPVTFHVTWRERELTFATDSGVFSRQELDRGSKELLDALPESLAGRVLDMGCGYGALGVSIGAVYPDCRVTMADINERAVGLAAQNARQNGVTAETLASDGYAQLTGRTFDLIVTNPPIRAGKAVIYRMFADGAAALAEGGTLYLVVRKQQGAASAMTYLQTRFQQVQAVAKKGGYWVIRCGEPHT